MGWGTRLLWNQGDDLGREELENLSWIPTLYVKGHSWGHVPVIPEQVKQASKDLQDLLRHITELQVYLETL